MRVGDLPACSISFSRRGRSTSSGDHGMNYNSPYFSPLLPEGLKPFFRVLWVPVCLFIRGWPSFLISSHLVGGLVFASGPHKKSPPHTALQGGGWDLFFFHPAQCPIRGPALLGPCFRFSPQIPRFGARLIVVNFMPEMRISGVC